MSKSRGKTRKPYRPATAHDPANPIAAALEIKRQRDAADATRKAGIAITANHGRMLSLAVRQASAPAAPRVPASVPRKADPSASPRAQAIPPDVVIAEPAGLMSCRDCGRERLFPDLVHTVTGSRCRGGCLPDDWPVSIDMDRIPGSPGRFRDTRTLVTLHYSHWISPSPVVIRTLFRDLHASAIRAVRPSDATVWLHPDLLSRIRPALDMYARRELRKHGAFRYDTGSEIVTGLASAGIIAEPAYDEHVYMTDSDGRLGSIMGRSVTDRAGAGAADSTWIVIGERAIPFTRTAWTLAEPATPRAQYVIREIPEPGHGRAA